MHWRTVSRSWRRSQRARQYRQHCVRPAPSCRWVLGRLWEVVTQLLHAQAVREDAAKALRARDAQLRAFKREVEDLLKDAASIALSV